SINGGAGLPNCRNPAPIGHGHGRPILPSGWPGLSRMNELIIIRPSGGNKPANAEGKMVIVRLLIILRVVRVGLAQGRCEKSTKRKCQTKGEWVTIQQLVQKC